LKPEGLMADPSGWGLACYHHAPEETDAARRRNILAALAGFAPENRFREQRSVRNLWECGPACFQFRVSTQLEILVYESHLRHRDRVPTGQRE
jgi:hypothetical protein